MAKTFNLRNQCKHWCKFTYLHYNDFVDELLEADKTDKYWVIRFISKEKDNADTFTKTIKSIITDNKVIDIQIANIKVETEQEGTLEGRLIFAEINKGVKNV